MDFTLHSRLENAASITNNAGRVFRRAQKTSDLRSSVECDTSFIRAISPVAAMAQCLALVPVCGVLKGDPERLQFKLKSVRAMYALGQIVYNIFVSSCMLKYISGEGISAKNIVGFVFFSYTTVCVVVLFMIARQWPKLMVVWTEKEKRFLKFPYKRVGLKLSTKIRVTAVVILCFALCEHVLFLVTSSYNQYKKVVRCNMTVERPLSYFLENQFHFLFVQVNFSLPLGLFVEIMNVSMTFAWNYMELFVMMVSIGLYTRFQQINKRLEGLKGKVLPESVWVEIRTDYVTLCELMERVDYELRYLLLLSNLNNLYFICFQLFNIYDSLPYLISYVYFWFSLIYLFGRTLTTQYLAALIHHESNQPLSILKAVPFEGNCIEVDRFIDQIRTQTMAFSGYRFFYLTRQTIMAMLATIVTYELVLMQFDNDPSEQVDRNLNIDDCDLNVVA